MLIPWQLIVGGLAATFLVGKSTATPKATNWQILTAVAAGALGAFLLARSIGDGK